MLTIAQVSGLIAAAVMVVQYGLPAALVIILVKSVGNINTAATWSSVNRTIATTLWPLLLRSDSARSRSRSRSVVLLSWTMTTCAVLLVIAGVVAPLGLHEEIVANPGAARSVLFQYTKDPSPWGLSTLDRPHLPFGRYCEFGRRINCPAQYQGVDFVEVEDGTFQSVKTDNSSTINTTVPANYTAMFSSATDDPGNTLSGLFDVQFRRWTVGIVDIIDHGAPLVGAESRAIELLIPQNDTIIKEGVIVDVRDNPGIGYRNHTVPLGLPHGGTWSEDISWIEPVSACVDTNLSIEIDIRAVMDSFLPEEHIYLVDRGAFRDLDLTALESRPWLDNQTLDLPGRAYKAARMYNVLAASFLNVSLPINSSTGILPKFEASTNSSRKPNWSGRLFTSGGRDLISIGDFKPLDDSFDGSFSVVEPPDDFVPEYPDGMRKMFVSNLTSISQVCKGFYILDSASIDRRAANLTNPMVECGLIISPARSVNVGRGESGVSTPYDDLAKGIEIKRRDLFVCATGVRASVKTIDFRYNGTGTSLENLRIDRIADKQYPDEQSKPLWAVETSGNQRMTFDPLWGMVSDKYENTEGFYTMRSEKLWLPTGVSTLIVWGNTFTATDTLSGPMAPAISVGNLYKQSATLDESVYSGRASFPLIERFAQLAKSHETVSQIPNLILADSLASLLVGTKTSIRTDPVGFPAMLSVNDPVTGLSRASVVPYRRVIRYDLRFAVPGFLVLAVLVVVFAWAAVIVAFEGLGIVRILRDMYNQTSTGRLATLLLRPGQGNPNESERNWAKADGNILLDFGRFGNRRSDYFVRVSEADNGLLTQPARPEVSGAHIGYDEFQQNPGYEMDPYRDGTTSMSSFTYNSRW
ncbi:hypothetical protein F5X68DRAFT_257152 [Plectosphaerella plurivora]|uniref:Uncharacterized protein n=1 Tax=Plectosphaerella plurivora TaxID=936078 RepID=A0A9P8VKC8_9PEZI|nr:hypothetical protein F5X68DRAFT_257152 [Plectosphaerella plurivora]